MSHSFTRVTRSWEEEGGQRSILCCEVHYMLTEQRACQQPTPANLPSNRCVGEHTVQASFTARLHQIDLMFCPSRGCIFEDLKNRNYMHAITCLLCDKVEGEPAMGSEVLKGRTIMKASRGGSFGCSGRRLAVTYLNAMRFKMST